MDAITVASGLLVLSHRKFARIEIALACKFVYHQLQTMPSDDTVHIKSMRAGREESHGEHNERGETCLRLEDFFFN